MKKLFYVCFLLLGSVSLYAAETISSVSFNPSRMGEYTYLKVADKATLKGGLKTPQLNVSVGGTVSVYPDTSSRVYAINQVNGQVQTAIEMENTVFHGNNVNQYAGYKSETNSTPGGLLNTMSIYGGDQEYTQDSYIRTLDAVNILRQRVGTLKSGRLSIGGDNGQALSLYEGDSTYGFYLAGNDIPEPTAEHTNTGKELTGCNLVWEKRKTSASPAQEVYLLALQGCNGEETPSQNQCPASSCTPGTTKTENCTGGTRKYVCDGYPYCNWRKVSDNCNAVQYYWRSMGTTNLVYSGPCRPAGGTCDYYYTSAGLPFGRVKEGERCTGVGFKGYSSCTEYTSAGRCFMTYNVLSCQN